MQSETTKGHTPGPWRHVGTGIEARAFDGSWKWITPSVHGGSPSQATANRALMAAAPDLLECAKRLVAVANEDRPEDWAAAVYALEAAIAKAEPV